MNRKTVSGIMVTLLLIGIVMLAFNIQPVKSGPTTIIVPDDYATIQEAINNANEGDTIYAKAQLYYENIVINKNNLTLLGEDKDTTIIDGSGSLTVMHVTANNVIISGFTIQNGFGGIILVESDSCAISGNIITNNGNATRLTSSDYCHIVGNVISDNFVLGIRLSNSDNSNISNNILVGNGHGIGLASHSMNNIVVGNKVTLGYDGISLTTYSNNNVVACNILSDNQQGIYLYLSSKNTIYHNNFVNNTEQIYDYSWDHPEHSPSINTWDNGYPSGGNYWSDYNGLDTNEDGIGDTPYFIDENNRDNYPLMTPYISPAQMTALYYDLLEKLDELLFRYNSLNQSYQELLGNLTDLQAEYDSLLATINDMQGQIDSLNLTLQISADELQGQIDSLNSTLLSGQEAVLNELVNTRTLLYVFITATASLILIATIVYFALRKPKIKPQRR